jgi:hypothetical protein
VVYYKYRRKKMKIWVVYTEYGDPVAAFKAQKEAIDYADAEDPEGGHLFIEDLELED